MKILVLGAGGMAGHTVSIYFQEQGHEVFGFARRQLQYMNAIVGDAHGIDKLCQIILEGKFDSVINCVGILNQFAENNPQEAEYLNAKFPHLLADITAGTKTKVIHMSTDCVFSGKKGQYTENDTKDGESVYDHTKALGELNDKKNLTLRNSIVGPDINPQGIGLFNWFMKQTGIINGFTQVYWTGMTTLQLAKVMEQSILCDACGLYNMVPANKISKYDLLGLFNKYFRNGKIDIQPKGDIVLDKSLVRTNFDKLDEVPDYDTMVREMYDWVIRHKELYPHYIL